MGNMERCKDNSCDVCQEWGVVEGEVCNCTISESEGAAMFFECSHHNIPDDAYYVVATVIFEDKDVSLPYKKRLSKEEYDELHG